VLGEQVQDDAADPPYMIKRVRIGDAELERRVAVERDAPEQQPGQRGELGIVEEAQLEVLGDVGYVVC